MGNLISIAEIQNLTGISGNDSLLRVHRDIATELLESILNVESLESHTVTDEEIHFFDPYFIIFEQFPVDVTSISLKDSLKSSITTTYSFELPPNGKRRARILDSDNIPTIIGYDYVYATYTAGYTTQTTIEVLTQPNAGDKLYVDVAGTRTEWEFVSGTPGTNEIEIGATEADTAANIASELDGTSSSETATLPVGTKAELSTGLTTADFTITLPTFPDALKMCIALIAGAGVSRQSNLANDIKSLKIDDKTIQYVDGANGEGNSLESILSYYIGYFSKNGIKAI